MKVYLAGNLHTDWRSQIVEACPNIEFLQPYKDYEGNFVRTEEGKSIVFPDLFTARDLLFVRECDVFFGYITRYGERSRHHGTMIELGYAKALGKLIILAVDIPSFDMAMEVADVVFSFNGLRRGIDYLLFLTMKNPI